MGDVPLQLTATRATDARCPYCHDGIQLEGRVWLACEGCLARHHRACWQDTGGCSSCGGTRVLSPRLRRVESYQRWSRRRARWDLLVLGLGAVFLLIATGTLAYRAGRIQEQLKPEHPRVTELEYMLEVRAAALREYQTALSDHGHAKTAKRLAVFHVGTQPQRVRMLHELFKIRQKLDRKEPMDAALLARLDRYEALALQEIQFQFPPAKARPPATPTR